MLFNVVPGSISLLHRHQELQRERDRLTVSTDRLAGDMGFIQRAGSSSQPWGPVGALLGWTASRLQPDWAAR